VEALLAFAAALVALRLSGRVAGRWRARRAPELLAWSAALFAYAVAAAALAWGAAHGWDARAFRAYYLFGGLLTAPLLGAGSLLLWRRRAAGPVALLYAGLAVGIAIAVPVHGAFSGGGIPAAQDHLGFFPARFVAILANSLGTAAVVAFCLGGCLLVSAVSLAVGAALFPIGPVTLLSGTTISLAAGLLRLLLVTLYVAGAMAALAAIGLAISTFTEHAIAAIAALLVIAVASEGADSVPQFAVVHPYLPTHWWLSFDALLRAPVAWPDLLDGLLSFGVYVVIFGAIAWARITTADVTS